MSSCIWGIVGGLNVGVLGYSHLRRKKVSDNMWDYNTLNVLTDWGYIRLVARIIESQSAIQGGASYFCNEPAYVQPT